MKNPKPSAAGCLLYDPYPPQVRLNDMAVVWERYKNDQFAALLAFVIPVIEGAAPGRRLAKLQIPHVL